MRGAFALLPEILAGLDQSAAEDLLPESIYRHPCRERVVFVDQPTGQSQAVDRRAFGHRGQHGGSRREDLFAFVQKTAAFVEEGRRAVVTGPPLPPPPGAD